MADGHGLTGEERRVGEGMLSGGEVESRGEAEAKESDMLWLDDGRVAMGSRPE